METEGRADHRRHQCRPAAPLPTNRSRTKDTRNRRPHLLSHLSLSLSVSPIPQTTQKLRALRDACRSPACHRCVHISGLCLAFIARAEQAWGIQIALNKQRCTIYANYLPVLQRLVAVSFARLEAVLAAHLAEHVRLEPPTWIVVRRQRRHRAESENSCNGGVGGGRMIATSCSLVGGGSGGVKARRASARS